MMPEPVLVVDLGSTAVSAALVAGGQARLMKEPGGNALRWPSSLCADADGLSVGTAAERRKRAAPAGYVADVRARVIDPAPLVAGDRSLTGPDVVAVVLAALRAEAERLHGTALTRLTLTVPVDWPPGHPGRDALIAAGEAADFLDVDLLAEPVAAALDPESGGSAEPAVGALVLVCDLGARGAVTLVRFTGPSSADIVEHRVVPGGAELDRLVLDRVRADGRSWVEPLLAADGDAGLRGRFEVDNFVRRLRHQLSDSEQAEDNLTPLAPSYTLSRATFEGLARPVLDDLVGGCAAVLVAAETSTEQLGRVVLTGGLCRMPAPPDLVGPTLALVPINVSRQPELAVVRGAARWTELSATRQVEAPAPQRWQDKPLIWTVPNGTARLLRWTVDEGSRFEANSVLAIARAGDDTLLDITAQRPGTLLECRLTPGADLSGALAAVARLDPADEYIDISASAIVLGPGRDTFIELGSSNSTQGPQGIRVRRFEGDLRIQREEALDSSSGLLSEYGVFRGPDNVLVLVGKIINYPHRVFVVVDLTEGTPILTFRDRTNPFTFLINEDDWTMVTKSSTDVAPAQSSFAGPADSRWWRNVFRKPAEKENYDRQTRCAVWSLAEKGGWRRRVEHVAQMNYVAWSSKYDPARFTSPAESRGSGFTKRATSPDGKLSARINARYLDVRQVPSGTLVFSAPLPEGEARGVAFNADGTYLAACSQDNRLDRVRVWQL